MPRDAAAHTIYLADYQPYGFVIDDVQLTFRLNANRTIVQSRIAFRPNPETTNRDFYLDGLDLDLLSATIDGQPVTARIDGGQLRALSVEIVSTKGSDVTLRLNGDTAKQVVAKTFDGIGDGVLVVVE